jgi:hypothetical protein
MRQGVGLSSKYLSSVLSRGVIDSLNNKWTEASMPEPPQRAVGKEPSLGPRSWNTVQYGNSPRGGTSTVLYLYR